MANKQKLFSSSNKKAFTLIEVLISVSILVLIFTFLYSQFNLAQKSTKKTTQIEKSTTKRAKIIELLYADFISSRNLLPTTGRKYDKFSNAFSTENSLYSIQNPFVKYVVVSDNEGNQLVRIEGKRGDIGMQNVNKDFYIDSIVKEIKYFKIIVSPEYIEFFVQAKDMKDIYFKLKRVIH
jgi:prepilin-type N-terminal cleavage/methylation domain-containing protein